MSILIVSLCVTKQATNNLARAEMQIYIFKYGKRTENTISFMYNLLLKSYALSRVSRNKKKFLQL